MKSFVRNLSVPAEFCLIILVCFGLSIFTGIREAVSHMMHDAPPFALNNSKVLWLISYELLASTAVFLIARIRGWSFATFGLHISWKWTGAGILLFVAVVLAAIFQTLLFQVIHPAKIVTPLTGGLTLPFVILMLLINPAFEELMEVGYFVHALKQYGMWPAVLASALFRTVLHAYAGLTLAVTCLLVGLIFGFAYWRWRQLWPLFIAHAIMDFYALHRLIQPA